MTSSMEKYLELEKGLSSKASISLSGSRINTILYTINILYEAVGGKFSIGSVQVDLVLVL